MFTQTGHVNPAAGLNFVLGGVKYIGAIYPILVWPLVFATEVCPVVFSQENRERSLGVVCSHSTTVPVFQGQGCKER